MPYGKFYEKLIDRHISNTYEDRDKMLRATWIFKSSTYRKYFVKCCTTCVEKKQLLEKPTVVKPILSNKR